jgi:outer membrane murein-binding lipoprotein Lpp
MRKTWYLIPVFSLAACHREEFAAISRASVPGYWFQIIFIVTPLVVILVKLFVDFAALRASFFALESQLRRLNARLDELEEKLKAAFASKAKARRDSKEEN